MASVNLTFMGDSKTASYGFQPELLREINGAEAPVQLATNGWKVSDLEAATDAWLTAATSTPAHVLINIGINDISDATDQAVYEAKLGSILDKVHAKWTSAVIYVARVWKRDADTACNAMDDIWIPNVLAPRPWAQIGIDERVELKASDNGASRTTEGTHPNTLGYHFEYVAWRTRIGL